MSSNTRSNKAMPNDKSKNDQSLDRETETHPQSGLPDDPLEKITPDTMSEATTVPLKDDALGGHATQDDVK